MYSNMEDEVGPRINTSPVLFARFWVG